MRHLRDGSSIVLERARSQAGHAAAITAAIVLLSSAGANAQFRPNFDALDLPALLEAARRCDAEAIDTLEQMQNADERAADTQTQAGDEQRTTRRERREERREERRAETEERRGGWSDSEGARNLLQSYKDKCFPSENARSIWFEAPNTIANAVWDEVLFQVFKEITWRKNELDSLELAQHLFEELARRRRASGAASGMPSRSLENHPYAQLIRELTARVAQPLAFRQRMLDAGLTPDEFDALAQFAFQALDTYSRTRLALHAEIVCERRDTFESPAAWGRAIDEVEALMHAEVEQMVAGLFEAIGTQTAEKVAIFAMEAAPDTMRWENREATFPLMDPADLTRMFEFGCQPAVPLVVPAPDAPTDSASRRQRRR